MDSSTLRTRRSASRQPWGLHVVLALVALTTLVPFLIIISSSITEERTLIIEGYRLFPKNIDFTAYEFIVDRPQQILSSYGVTIFITTVGTTCSLLFMTMMAYAMSRRAFRLRNFFGIFVVVTMLFNGGLVPYYILVTQYLKLRNTLIVLLLPNLIGPYQIILLRTYFLNLPDELFDAARVDGAGEWRVLFQLVFQLGKPALATIGLMMALLYWNNWTTALYFIDSPELYPLQYLLYQVMRDAEALALEPQLGGTPLPSLATRMAMAVIATGPAAIGFLFAQKYLVRGITLGALK